MNFLSRIFFFCCTFSKAITRTTTTFYLHLQVTINLKEPVDACLCGGLKSELWISLLVTELPVTFNLSRRKKTFNSSSILFEIHRKSMTPGCVLVLTFAFAGSLCTTGWSFTFRIKWQRKQLVFNESGENSVEIILVWIEDGSFSN